MADEHVSARTTIPAPAGRVFAVLADPSTHADVDGTGWVTGAVDVATLSDVGQLFTMAMYHPDHADGAYETVNEVIVLDPPSAIAWRTGYVEPETGRLAFGGWWWRYDLEPVGPERCAVTLTYDWSDVGPGPRAYLSFPPFPPEHLDRSLAHLAGLAGPPAPVGP